jgi:hypothetical protein
MQQNINIGTPNNNDGDFVRDAFSKTESNFTELYAKVNTSDFVNDGANSTSTYVETDELGVTAFTNDYNDLNNLPTIPDASTGLEALDEGNGIGWRLIGSNPNNSGNIGLHAIDMGIYESTSSIYGALAPLSFIGNGEENIISGAGATGAFTLGYGGNAIAGNSQGSGALGIWNTISNGYASMALGSYNTLAMNSNGFGFAAGMGNDLLDIGTSAIGIALYSTARNQHAVGIANTIWSGSVTDASRPIFTVGNGTSSTPSGKWVASVRSDAFNVRFNGVIDAPSLTIAEINAENTGKVLITREWIESQSFGSGVANLPEQFTAIEGQTLFTLSVTPNNADVHFNHVWQIPTTDYTLTGNLLTLSEPATAGDIITVRPF